jgi:acetyl-CoA acetyltransferase
MNHVAILGVGMHRFGLWADRSDATMAREAGLEALGDAGISFADVQAAYVGHIWAPVTGAVRVMKEFGLTGIPIQRIENASATGSAAFREACLAVESGRYEIVMVLGFDSMTRMLKQAARGPKPEGVEDIILPSAFFAMWATRRMHERGTTPEHLARIAAKNWNNGALNPNSQRQPDNAITVEQVLASRMVAWPLTTMMSCPVGDGAAAVIIARSEIARRVQPDRPLLRVLASELQSERYAPGHLFQGPVVGPAQMTRDTAQVAYDEAGIGPEDLDIVQVHDAFSIEELEYYELLGLCAEGEGEAALERGDFDLGGRVPVSTDGGLIARGHPGGPTGLAQIWESVVQLRGQAGKRQVENPRTALCQMMGGGSVCCIHIVGRR